MGRKPVVPREWRWDAGARSLDLVNTLRRRWQGGIEQLRTSDDLALWIADSGLTDAPAEAIVVDEHLLVGARSLREAMNDAVEDLASGTPVRRGALATLQDWLEREARPPVLRLQQGSGCGLTVGRSSIDPVWALRTLTEEFAQLLGSDERVRLRICDEALCTIRFYDRSRAGSRRWCSNNCSARHHMRQGRQRSASDRSLDPDDAFEPA